MEIYLVRHTETICEKGICYGQADVALRPFKEQFEMIKEQIPADALFYSSPLQRCAILAKYLSDDNYQTDSRLMEMNFGEWELQNWDAINPETLNPWMEDFVNVKVPGGESFTELYNRADEFITIELPKLNPSKPIVLVTHAGVIRSILCKISDLPLKDAFLNKLDFGQVIKVEY